MRHLLSGQTNDDGYLLRDAEVGCVDHRGILRSNQRGDGAAVVALVASLDGRADLSQRSLAPALFEPPQGSGFDVGVEKHFDIGGGEHRGADISPLHHHPLPGLHRPTGDFALHLAEAASDPRHLRHIGNASGDLHRSDRFADVSALQPHQIPIQADVKLRGEQSQDALEIFTLLCPQAFFQRLQGDLGALRQTDE